MIKLEENQDFIIKIGSSLRKKAIEWWEKLLFVEKWEQVVKNKEKIKGYPDRDINTLTGNEIEKIYTEYFK